MVITTTVMPVFLHVSCSNFNMAYLSDNQEAPVGSSQEEA